MSYGKAQLEDLTIKLKKIRDALLYELPEYWWLSQGEAAVVVVRMVKKNKKINIFETPKLTLKAAIRTVIENIEVAKKLKGTDFFKVMQIIEEDIANITDVYSMIKEAHEVVKKMESLKRMVSSSDLHKTKKDELTKILNSAIKWIKEVFSTNPRDWKKRKEYFEKIANKVEEQLKAAE